MNLDPKKAKQYLQVMIDHPIYFDEIPEEYHTKEIMNLALESDALNLQYIKNPTYEMCLKAVTDEGGTLEFVKKQTVNICLAAIKSSPEAFEFVSICENPDFQTTKKNLLELKKIESNKRSLRKKLQSL